MGLFLLQGYKPVLSTQGVRSINHPLCRCAVKVIPQNHLFQYNVVVQATLSEGKVILWSIKQIVLHIVFSPKYRRKVIYNQYRESLQDIIRTLCRYKGVEILEGHMMSDHVHLVLSISPKISVSSFMGYLKGKSALMMFERHAN